MGREEKLRIAWKCIRAWNQDSWDEYASPDNRNDRRMRWATQDILNNIDWAKWCKRVVLGEKDDASI